MRTHLVLNEINKRVGGCIVAEGALPKLTKSYIVFHPFGAWKINQRQAFSAGYRWGLTKAGNILLEEMARDQRKLDAEAKG